MEHWQALRCGRHRQCDQEAGMLPRVATTTGTVQPTPVLPGASSDAAAKPQLSAAALANLKADVLLRLIETMLKHMPRTAEPNPGRDLIETLLAALKTMPGHEGEGARKLADIIARLPPELRPSVEKLINTVLSAMPTRSLIEIVRNPNGPEAQKLAHFLATNLDLDDLPATGTERQQKPLGLTAQQLAAVGRHGTQQSAQTAQMLGDARLLQTTLKRIFDLDGNSKPRPLPGRTADGGADLQMTAGTIRPAAEAKLPNATRTDAHLPASAAKAATQEHPVEASAAAARHNGDAEEVQAAAPALKRDVSNTAGQALARSVLQAVARDVSPDVLMQAVAHLVLRTLLERPLDPAMEDELALIVREHVDDAIEEGLGSTLPKTRPEAGQPSVLQPSTIDGDELLSSAQAKDAAQAATETGKTRAEGTQSASLLQQPATERDDPLPMLPARDAGQPAADALPDKLLAATVLREGVPLAFVPYLPAEEDIAWPEAREAEEEETADEEEAGEEGGDAANGDTNREAAEEEPESADMARRREKAAEMVGVLEPGLHFYQKLGDYWT
jgi:hypothetical protein